MKMVNRTTSLYFAEHSTQNYVYPTIRAMPAQLIVIYVRGWMGDRFGGYTCVTQLTNKWATQAIMGGVVLGRERGREGTLRMKKK